VVCPTTVGPVVNVVVEAKEGAATVAPGARDTSALPAAAKSPWICAGVAPVSCWSKTTVGVPALMTRPSTRVTVTDALGSVSVAEVVVVTVLQLSNSFGFPATAWK
jgi:hypothetical protein